MKRPIYRLLVLTSALFIVAAQLSAATMTAAQSKEVRQNLVSTARTYIGTPYVTGGTTASGMDCSGLIYTVVRQTMNKSFPRTVAQQYAECEIIKDAEKENGDLVFFKTVGDRISHVGLYVGNNQFIHAASDGPNTGVIMSSLKESYWKEHYYCAGRFLPATQAQTAAAGSKPSGSSSNSGSAGITLDFADIISHTNFELTAEVMTALMTKSDVMLTIRGIDMTASALVDTGTIQPGLAAGFRYDAKTHLFQIPLTLTVATSEFLRFYIGPVISMGNAVIPGSEEPVQPSVFPGIIGLSWQSPSITTGSVPLRFCADASYLVFNTPDGAALSPFDSFLTGFTFNLGLRVTLPRL